MFEFIVKDHLLYCILYYSICLKNGNELSMESLGYINTYIMYHILHKNYISYYYMTYYGTF